MTDMRYDPSVPVAVFLGPSLGQDEARRLLPANYYPPVRMGDVYRLMTCGVRLIVLIDGVFHKTTPVWQREIVAAMANGITVVGASSMGALRALELEPFGMRGHGTVFEWYKTGRIEGDDEVALHHADEEFGYRALSEPMVNIRHVLDRAVAGGVLAADEAGALADAMKARDHGRRSYSALLRSDAFDAMAADVQARVRAFLAVPHESLKAADARAALEWCAAHLSELCAPQAGARPPGRQLERLDEVLMRGVPAPDGTLVPVRRLLVRAAEDAAEVAAIVRRAAERFFLLDWMRHEAILLPDGVLAQFGMEWRSRAGIGDLAGWLRTNALTAAEFQRELSGRAAAAWLQGRGPAAFGLARPFLEAWAEAWGIDAPRAVSPASFSERLLEKGPTYFGFDQWSPDLAVVRELQMHGRMAALARLPAPGVVQLEVADAGAGAL